MSVPVFLELVEAKTKLASVLPFFIGTLFAATYFEAFAWGNTLIFFVAMLIFDMTTTAINNLMDYQKARDDAYRRQVNIIGTAQLNPWLVVALILGMLAVSGLLGLWLVVRTGWPLLIMGVICFFIGIFYTFGPLPLSRLPLGELFSGVTMGLGIPLIAVFVNTGGQLFIEQRGAFWLLVLICVMPMATIANVMLANNLSDYEQDIKNQRRTLPIVIGQRASLWLYAGLAYIGYASLAGAVWLGYLGWPILLSWLTLPLVIKNTRIFMAKQDKRLTFNTALKNLVLENASFIIGLVIWLVLKQAN